MAAPTRTQMAAPTRTANGEYDYDAPAGGATIRELVDAAHRALGAASGWEYVPLRPGAFGFDNLACSVGRVADALRVNPLLDEAAAARAVHGGWCANYRHWRDAPPAAPDRAPREPLGDARRDACLAADFDELPADEREKDLVVARSVLERLRK